jgi:hypothetical protein
VATPWGPPRRSSRPRSTARPRTSTGLHCLRYAVDVADLALHQALLRAGDRAGHVVIGNTLHVIDGCLRARQAHPAAVELGAYRASKMPMFLTAAEGERWLTASSKRKRCRRCALGV